MKADIVFPLIGLLLSLGALVLAFQVGKSQGMNDR